MKERHFIIQISDMFSNLATYVSDEMLVVVLQLFDKVIVSSLVVMVIIKEYESSVSKLNITDRERKVSWLAIFGNFYHS